LSIFDAALRLEQAQRAFISRHESLQSLTPGACNAGMDTALYQQALDAVALADSAREIHSNNPTAGPMAMTNSDQNTTSDSETDALDVTTTADPPPDCEEQGRQIREALYDNKYDRISPTTGRPTGGHGYLR